MYFGLFLVYGFVEDLFNVIYLVFGLLVCCSFIYIVILILCVLMENFYFLVGYLFIIFYIDKVIILVFDLGFVEEIINIEEVRLFCYYYINLLNYFLM